MSRHDQLALRRKVKGPQAEDDTVHVDDGLGCRLAALSTPDARVVNTIMRTHAGTRATARPDADYQGNFEAAIVVALHPQPSQAAEVADHLAALVVANHGARRELEAGSFELSVANAERGGEDHSGQDRAKRRCLGGFTRKQKADSAPICFYDDDNGCRGLATTTCTDTDQHYVDDHHPLTMIPIDRSKMARQTQGISVDASLRPPQLGRKGAAVGHCNGSFLNQSAGQCPEQQPRQHRGQQQQQQQHLQQKQHFQPQQQQQRRRHQQQPQQHHCHPNASDGRASTTLMSATEEDVRSDGSKNAEADAPHTAATDGSPPASQLAQRSADINYDRRVRRRITRKTSDRDGAFRPIQLQANSLEYERDAPD